MSGHSVLIAGLNGQRFTEANEAGLLVVAKRGETAAFDLLYRTYAERILRKVHGITRNHEEAEDAVQEAFLNAFRHIQTFDGRSAFSTWLTRIGINSALMMLRKKRNSHEVAPAQDSESGSTREAMDSAPDPEQQYAEQERLNWFVTPLRGFVPASAVRWRYMRCRAVQSKKWHRRWAFRFAQRRVVSFMRGRRCANRKFCAA